jgi:hydroxymethylbilane synthase
MEGKRLRLRALVAMPDGSSVVRAELQGPQSEPESLGGQLAAVLRQRGADAILAAVNA